MAKPWKSYYVVEPYHDGSFTCDEAGQAAMRTAALRRDRQILTAMVVMFVSFFLMLGSGVIWFVPGLCLSALLFLGAFLVSIALLLRGRPRWKCSRCGESMKTDWGPIGGARDGEYQICPACRTYVFNYRMSR